ncbi:DUF3413 domain-containing protein [Thalassotalea euphylliae]|uniref:DUF3413 domain-containing protein n=1 Tax=Thalassotalea euphylliae TaxID=1655234 RepID=A0A3E0TYK3_9GAMM|nr:DUF3413 domain-containing protein [Thalassotalea euphylliae]REL29544.1 DUF3413 domain-containing protein [Thalassotalea euphylliae]
MVSFESKTYSKKLLHLISWGHWFTFFNIIAAILLAMVYLVNEAAPQTLAGQVYLVSTWLSHMAFLTFMTFVLLVFPLTLLIPKTRFIRAAASIIFTAMLLLLLLDAFVYNRLGYHINASSIGQIIDLIGQEIQDDRRTFWFISLVLTLVILTFQLTVSNYAWKHLSKLQRTVFAKFVVFGLIVAFFTSHMMHIWADANLEYDVLKQDTTLPLSYPTTAKTLLTKYGMFNEGDYIARKTSPLAFNQPMPKYPTIGQCQAIDNQQSTFVILSKATLSEQQISQFSQRSIATSIKLSHHIDNATFDNAWFNLVYGLPTIYQPSIKQEMAESVMLQAIKQHKLTTSLTLITEQPSPMMPWFAEHFNSVNERDNIASLIFPEELAEFSQGLHFIYFDQEDTYQLELFIDALLLAQKQKAQQDNIIISSLGNASEQEMLSIKPALILWPEKRKQQISRLTSQMDIAPTLLTNWLGCQEHSEQLTGGKNVFKLKGDRVIANTTENGMVVFNKDKSVLIDQNGNFQSYSRQLAAPISVPSDFPLMIDGVHFIKRFSENHQQIQNVQ